MQRSLGNEPQSGVDETLRECSSKLCSRIERLALLLEAEPVEDGVTHPGEQMVAEIIATDGAEALAKAILEMEPPTLAAAMLRLLGRADPPAKSVREPLVDNALRSENVEIRDAAVQAVELWRANDLAHLLVRHRESVPWLAEYIGDVVAELRGP